MADYSWFNKRRQRSIDQLRPWSNNPRLNPCKSCRSADQGTVLRSALFPVEKAVDDSVWDSGESGKLSEIHRRYDTRETVF